MHLHGKNKAAFLLSSILSKPNVAFAAPRLRAFSKGSSSSASKDPYDNIPESIVELTQRKIYKTQGHPLSTLIE